MCEMNLKRVEHTKNYTTIDLTVANDNRLSWGAVGLHLYLYSRASIPGWKIQRKELIARHTEGRDALQGLINELKALGYLKIEANREPETGRLNGATYYVSEIAIKDWIADEPQTGKPSQLESGVLVEGEKTEESQAFTNAKNSLSSYKKDNINKLNNKNKNIQLENDDFYLNMIKEMIPAMRATLDMEANKSAGIKSSREPTDQRIIDQMRIKYLKKLHKADQLGEFQPILNRLQAKKQKEHLEENTGPPTAAMSRLTKELLARTGIYD